MNENFNFSKPHILREDIEKILGGLKPIKLENYRRALVHKSVQKFVRNALNEGKEVCSYLIEEKKPCSNERLEFFGDSVLNHIVTEYIFTKYPGKDEGFMTRLRTKIVRDTHCVKFANIIGINKFILSNSVVNDKILEDAFEAFLGAIVLDLGFEFAKKYITILIDKNVNFEKILEDDNYKDILMRYIQNKGLDLPVYKEIKKCGPSHKRIFIIQVVLKIDREYNMGEGKGSSKKEAEQAAAFETLKMIENSDLENIIKRIKTSIND